MENFLTIAILLLISVLLFTVGSIPSLLIWLCARYLLPRKYTLPPLKMTITCAILAMGTFALIEKNLLAAIEPSSVGIFLFFSVIWSIILLIIVSAGLYTANRINSKGN